MITESIKKPKENNTGRNVQRIRMFLGIKQETLADGLGVSGSEVSKIEKQEEIDEELLSRIAGVLGVSSEMIRDFDVEKAIYNINSQHNYQNATISDGATTFAVERGSPSITQHINPLEKIVELYERLLKSEREKNELLKNK